MPRSAIKPARAETLARDIQGLRLAEEGWEQACAATPETAFLTKVRLEHLRWYAAKLAPKKYGAPAQMAEPAEAADERPGMTVIVKSFRDVTPEEEAAHDETERRFARLGRV